MFSLPAFKAAPSDHILRAALILGHILGYPFRPRLGHNFSLRDTVARSVQVDTASSKDFRKWCAMSPTPAPNRTPNVCFLLFFWTPFRARATPSHLYLQCLCSCVVLAGFDCQALGVACCLGPNSDSPWWWVGGDTPWELGGHCGLGSSSYLAVMVSA